MHCSLQRYRLSRDKKWHYLLYTQSTQIPLTLEQLEHCCESCVVCLMGFVPCMFYVCCVLRIYSEHHSMNGCVRYTCLWVCWWRTQFVYWHSPSSNAALANFLANFGLAKYVETFRAIGLHRVNEHWTQTCSGHTNSDVAVVRIWQKWRIIVPYSHSYYSSGTKSPQKSSSPLQWTHIWWRYNIK